MEYEWHDLVGNIGVLCVLGTYLGLQLEKIEAVSTSYCVLNALGSMLILISLAYDFNLSSVIIEGAWLVISLIGLGRQFLKTP